MATRQNMPYRLGLDLGTNSIGWAAIRLDEHGNPCGILDMGVRVFPDGRDAKSKESNAKTRRDARGARRRRDRYQKRRADLLKTLVEFGLMPPDERERKALAGRHDPYGLRARALDDPLHPYELGRALFHLNQRRGFKSNRKAEQDGESESGVIKQAAEALEDQLDADDARTLGEFLDQRRRAGKPTRFRNQGTGTTAKYEFYPTRRMLADEFDQIRDTQEARHTLSPEQWDALRDRIFFQRRLRPVDPGWCQFEAGESRAARALPVAQEFRMLQEVNNLRVRVGIEPERRLNTDERQRALERLRSGKDINLAKPTQDLKLRSQTTFNLARGGRNIVKGDETAVRLIKEKGRKGQALFGDRWLKLPLNERNEIVRFMLDNEDPEAVRRKALAAWGLNETQAKAVADIGMPPGYANLSEQAIRKLLPHLAQGAVFSDAVLAAGYRHHSDFRGDEAHDRLPYYGVVLERDAVGADPTKDPAIDGETARYGRLPNPTVNIGLNQLRRVVNQLIEVFGKPSEIVMELARDLKANTDQRMRDQARQREGRERNERFAEMLASAGADDTPHIRRKLRLWEEQGQPQARVCPYTGRTISCAMAMDGRTEIDHILPFSRTLDDSMSNKVVCLRGANQAKGNQSPWEAFHHDPSEYEGILARAAALPDNKRWRFEPDAMQRFEEEERDFLDRQLNETRYLSRIARAYLACLYDEKTEGRLRRVRAIPGHMTTVLRRGWGLEGMLRADPRTDEIVRKQRDDHRHHAIDAFVVANTTQGLLQRFAHASSSRRREAAERLAAIADDVRPWDGFSREDLRPFLDHLVVSYKPDHGTRGQPGMTTGQLHNDTAYGLVRLSDDGPSEVVVRKSLDKLKRGDLAPVPDGKPVKGIKDLALRAALLQLWDKVGGKAADFAHQAASGGVLLSDRRQRVRHVRVLDKESVIPIKDRDGKPYKGYKSDGNEFVDVWEVRTGKDRNGNWKTTWKIVAVPRFHANQCGFNIEEFRPVVSRGKDKGKPDPTAKRIMRLYNNDMGALGVGAERRIVRVRKSGNGYVVLDDHNEADMDGRERRGEMDRNEGIYSATRLRKEGFRKVGVDEIGRIRDPGLRET